MPRKTYGVQLAASAARSLRKLDRATEVKIANAIDSLSSDPRPTGCVKLSDEEAIYRIRVSNYRILYSIADDVLIVLVIAIGNRREVYRHRK